jgi:formylglycine-generating enzyme required for sulfatase activity
MGSDETRDSQASDNETPQHQVELPAFLMARFPVTVAQFRRSGIRPSDEDGLNAPDTRPMTSVSLDEMFAYCAWLDRELRSRTNLPDTIRRALARGKVTLPSEAEWEKAARGNDGRIYPWGDQWKPENANASETGIGSTSAVGCFRLGRSPFDCEDMTGNVFEWTRSHYGSYPYPAKLKERAQRETASGDDPRVVRGDCFLYDQGGARAAYRLIFHPAVRGSYIGFRVVVSPSVSDL